jgi:hypothetical protein
MARPGRPVPAPTILVPAPRPRRSHTREQSSPLVLLSTHLQPPGVRSGGDRHFRFVLVPMQSGSRRLTAQMATIRHPRFVGQRPGGTGTDSCLQIPRAVGALISLWRGTTDLSAVTGFSHIA